MHMCSLACVRIHIRSHTHTHTHTLIMLFHGISGKALKSSKYSAKLLCVRNKIDKDVHKNVFDIMHCMGICFHTHQLYSGTT